MYIKKHYKQILEITVPPMDNASRIPALDAVKRFIGK
jgi:hypothetical protein